MSRVEGVQEVGLKILVQISAREQFFSSATK